MSAVVSRADLLALRERWRADGLKVVFTNGCFDLLHPGHIRLLESARSLGDRLVVAINSDASVRGLKGPTRPILPEQERAAVLTALEAVDAVTVFDEETPCPLLEKLLPDVLVKGSDWSHWIAGREIVEEAGGQVLPIPVEPGYSTTDVVRNILETHAAAAR
ncbi:MAG: D-glycero-beta-D-manno-heptose 1-phosphate adenylyltransferase [Acidobacteria bacterium]|nr:D-glycero-beta-D-manno-heptose 1-phosphate adenylyltransferase [Acidobacteriota bacterium]